MPELYGTSTYGDGLYGAGTLTGFISAYRDLLNTRINYLSPAFIRTTVPSVSIWCPSGTVGTYDFSNASMQDWYAVFDNAQAQGYSVIVAVNSPNPFTATSANFATAFSDLINYLVNVLGYSCIQYVSGLSEPDTNGASYSQYKLTIEPQLVAALSANSLLSAVQLLGPDTTSTDDSWLTSASTDLSGTLSGYVRHAFPPGATDISSGGREVAVKSLVAGIKANDPAGKLIIQGEMAVAALGPGQSVALYQYGVEMADFAVQLARAGMSALIAYILDDDMHGTQWGMWQITQDTGQPRPWFFIWSLLTRMLVPGSILYAPAQPSSNDLRALAAQSPQGAWTFVLVNRKATAQNIQVNVPFAPVVATTMQSYVYSSAAPLLVDTNGFPLASGALQAVLSRGFTVTLAANSVLILSQQTATTTNLYDVKRPPLQKRR